MADTQLEVDTSELKRGRIRFDIRDGERFGPDAARNNTAYMGDGIAEYLRSYLNGVRFR